MPVEYHHAACRYALSLPQVCCAVIGMVTPWELEQNLHRARTFQPLSPAEARRLQETGAPIARQWNDHLGPVV
jgi:predicted aldo/keto reductase-like oxidoreductase